MYVCMYVCMYRRVRPGKDNNSEGVRKEKKRDTPPHAAPIRCARSSALDSCARSSALDIGELLETGGVCRLL